MLINNKSLIKTINKLNLTDDEREKFNKISEDDRGNFLYNGKPVTGGATEAQAAQIEANKNALGGLSFKKIDTKEEYDNLPESDIGNPNLVIIKSYEEPITKDSFSLTVGENGEYQFRVNGDIKFSFNAGSGGVIENVIGNILLNSVF